MKANKSAMLGLSIAALIGCGHANSKSNDAAQAPSEEMNKSIVVKMEQQAPKFIIAIADKDGQIISTQTSDKMPEGASNEEIALNIVKNQSKSSTINVLTSDAADGKDQSTESYFWHGGGQGGGWNHGGGNGWNHGGGSNWGWNSSYYPVYAYQPVGYPTYYGSYAYNCGAPVTYGAAAYQVAVYNWASSYAYAPVGGCGYGYAVAYATPSCAMPFSYPSYY